jgi:hypothetical protein
VNDGAASFPISPPATISIEVRPVNDAPVAQGQIVSADEDTPVAIALVASDVDEDALTYMVSPPAHGALSGTGPNLTYRPAADYHGADSFTFKVNDGHTDSTAATVNILVAPVNDAPVAVWQSVSVNEDSSVAITLVATDVDGDPLSYLVVAAPSHGTLSGKAPGLTYHPAADYHGADNFTFKVSDAHVETGETTVNISVVSVNDAPVARATIEPLAARPPGETNWVVISPNGSNALVILDASLSSDSENDPLQFFWTEAGEVTPFATGVRTTNEFAAGFHALLLTVDDGVDSAMGELSFDVLTPGEAVEEVVLMVNGSILPRRTKRPLLATLKACVATFDRGNMTAALNQLQAFQNKVRAQVGRSEPGLADELIGACEVIAAAVERRDVARQSQARQD